MKNWILLAALAALALPNAASASSIDFGFTGGAVSAATCGPLSLACLTGSSTLTTVSLLPAGSSYSANLPTGLGSVSFSTGTLASGDLASGATFNAGGTVTITANGTWGGIAAGTVIYSGTFSGSATWSLVGTNYVLSGPLTGTLDSALASLINCSGCTSPAAGALATLSVTGAVPFSSSAAISSGNVNSVVPEPGTLALFGIGLSSVVGAIRRRMAKR